MRFLANCLMVSAAAASLFADQADPVAERLFQEGQDFAMGRSVSRDYSAAARLYQRAAERGFAPAQHNLGYLYENGLGVQQDFAQSQINLGVLYAAGNGLPRDDREAARWYQKTADQAEPRGAMYLRGLGVSKNCAQAFAYFQQAARLGHAVAQNNLALLYANGEGVQQSFVEAFAWLDVAADQLPAAATLRDQMSREMTPTQVEQAKLLARSRRREIAARP